MVASVSSVLRVANSCRTCSSQSWRRCSWAARRPLPDPGFFGFFMIFGFFSLGSFELKLAQLPRRSPLPVAPLPYVSLMPFASFFVVTNRPWFGKELIHFVVVGFERVAHDQEIATVVCDRVPVDDVGLMSILKIRDGSGAS